MFGYVKAYKPELKIKEYEMYKGIYCSLCKQLGKSYGFFSRFILNYDFTFLAMCLMATKKEESEFEKSHCSFCYAKKCICCKIPDSSLEYSAAITLIVAYYKVRDNFEDGRFFEKLQSALVLPYFKAKYIKATNKFPIIAQYVKNQMENQNSFEKSGISSIDRAADASAKALGKIFSECFDETQKDISYRFGYCLGRFIYICDALDDLEKDCKEKSFNPFLTENNNVDFKKIREDSLDLLDTTADELAKAYELIDFYRYKTILDNIVYYGLDSTINKVLRKEDKTDEKSL